MLKRVINYGATDMVTQRPMPSGVEKELIKHMAKQTKSVRNAVLSKRLASLHDLMGHIIAGDIDPNVPEHGVNALQEVIAEYSQELER